MMNVAVVGAGTMGHSIAQVFAQGGHEVFLNDISAHVLLSAENQISGNLDTMLEAGIINDRESVASVKERIQYTSDMPSAVKSADLVIEAIVEDPEAKNRLFTDLDRFSPRDAILASNTSYLDIFSIAHTVRPENMIIAHWFNPPHIVPLVEIVLGPKTSEETQSQVEAILRKLGKETITLKKYIPGFIGNRLQSALNLEFYHLLDNGIISPEDIDRVVQLSFGLRLPILGIAKRSDFTGLDLIQNILSNKSYSPPEVRGRCEAIDKLVTNEYLGVKTKKGFYDYKDCKMEDILRDRDLKLIKLKAFLAELLDTA